MWGIQFVSAWPERVLLFFACAAAMAAVVAVTRRVRPARLQPYIPPLAALLVFRGLYFIFPGKNSGDVALFLVLAVTFVYLPVWIAPQPDPGVPLKLGKARWLISVVLIPAIAAIFLNGWSVYYRLGLKLHKDEAVRKIVWVDLDSLALNAQSGTLYASGHGVSRLQAYDTMDFTRPPRHSQAASDRAQSFYYNPLHQELYLYNDVDQTLLSLDAATLNARRLTPNLEMTKGDSRIVYDGQTDSVIVGSEGTYFGEPPGSAGDPVAVVDRATGKVTYTLKDCGGGPCTPALIEIHPARGLVYFTFTKKVLVYNTITRRTEGVFASSSWVDGMALTPDGKELLVGVPLRSAILRLDAESLEPKGTIGATFGVRTLAVDPERNLVLAGSLATNIVEVIDLGTHKRLAKYYLAPWLRSICLDVRNRRAYVSSTEGLFAVDYTSRLPEYRRLPVRQTSKSPTAHF
jgi:hypothetical protein